MTRSQGTMNTVHLRYDGKSYDLPFSELGVSADSADVDVHEALARHFDVARHTFRAFVVERHRTGSMTVRPEAVFGSVLSEDEGRVEG